MVDNAQDLTFIIVGHATCKLQGSSDGGVTYADIAGSSTPSDGTDAQRAVIGMSHIPYDRIKVIFSAGKCVAIRNIIRQQPVTNRNLTFTKFLTTAPLGVA